MDIYYASYENIGPFYNKRVAVDFQDGYYLISAPIGSGKSFLFFDAILFGLYKYNPRLVLNRKANEGNIQIIFEANKDLYLLDRQLTPTKAGGQSVTSRLWKIQDKQILQDKIKPKFDDIISLDVDLLKTIGSLGDCVEIDFQNETEFQGVLEDMLVPREVFLSTSFLMQDSDNIFDMRPQERIDVFKNIFGLIGIDDAKDIITERKREISAELKYKKDKTSFNKKYNTILNKLLDYKDNLQKNLDNIQDFNELVGSLEHIINLDFFEDVQLIDNDKLSIDSLELDIDWDVFSKTQKQIKKSTQSYQQTKTNLKSLKQQKKQEQQTKEKLEQQTQNLQDEIKKLNQNISQIDTNQIDKLKTKKQNLQKDKKQIEQSVDYDKIESLTKSLIEDNSIKDIYDIIEIINELTSKGKTLSSEKQNIELNIEKLEKQFQDYKSEKKDLEIQKGTKSYEKLLDLISRVRSDIDSKLQATSISIDQLDQQIKDLKTTKDKLSKQISQLQKSLQDEKSFACDKINANCPYIDQIKKDSLETIEKQISKLQEQLETTTQKLQKAKKTKQFQQQNTISLKTYKNKININSLDFLKNKFQNFFEKIDEQKQKLKDEFDEKNYTQKLKTYKKQKQQINDKINNIKKFFKQTDWKQIKSDFQDYKQINNNISKIDKKISKLQDQEDKLDKLKKTLIEKKSQLKETKKQIKQQNDKLTDIDKKIQNKQKKLDTFQIKTLEKTDRTVQNIEKNFEKLTELLSDFKQNQIQVKKLQNDKKIVDDLYHIFTKELMLLVLQEFLPSLEDVINNFLSQVVDYSIKFNLIKKSKSKLKLDIKAHDNKGIRDVDSLSGGQKVILKIVWTLSVCVIMNTDFIFMDETINNLDQNTIGKVANLLNNYMSGKNNDKFYLITHSKQIQSMDIWDQVVVLNDYLS